MALRRPAEHSRACPRLGALDISGAQRGRGAGPATPPSAQASAPFDLTGYWVSVITEDWRWRMVTPKKGDYTSILQT